LVGIPVLGPARWMSQMIKGSSVATARPMVSRLQDNAGSGGGGHPKMPSEARAQRSTYASYLVLGLEGGNPESFVLAELVQHIRRRSDRIGTEEELPGQPSWMR
jgi:hypothetical protein